MLKVLLFESGVTGHVFHFVGLMIPPLLEMQLSVVLCVSENSKDSKEFKTHIEPYVGNNVLIDDTLPGDPKKNSARAKQLLLKIREHSPDHVYVPSGDGIVQSLALNCLLGPLCKKLPPIEVLLLNGKIGYGEASLVRRVYNHASARLCLHAPVAKIFHLDPFSAEVLTCMGKNRVKVEVMPEPVEVDNRIQKTQARRICRLPEHAKIVGTAGILNERKGTDLLISAIERLAPRSDAIFLFAGKCDEKIQKRLDELKKESFGNRVFVENRFLTNEQLMHYICSLDLVATPHRDLKRSSGIATRAIVSGLPVIGHDGDGWLRSMIERFDIGTVCNTEDPEAFASAIHASLLSDQNKEPENDRTAIRLFHSTSNYQAHWMAQIRNRLGHPPSRDVFIFPNA